MRLLAENRWPFRLHATYDESIGRFLDVFEAVNRDVPFDGLHWFFDHAETIVTAEPRADQGARRRHRDPAPDGVPGRVLRRPLRGEGGRGTPPIRRMLEMGIPVGAGTDATRVASYNPWVACTGWSTGRTVGGLARDSGGDPTRSRDGLRLWTEGSAWFSGEQDDKGRIAAGQFADLAVLDADYFSVPEEEIKSIASVLTIVGGRVVHGDQEFKNLAPPLPHVMPDWSPVRSYGGYQRPANKHATACSVHGHRHAAVARIPVQTADAGTFWRAFGCGCFAF